MFNRLSFLRYINASKENSIGVLERLISKGAPSPPSSSPASSALLKWPRSKISASFPAISNQESRILSSSESDSLILDIHDPEILQQKKASPKLENKIYNASTKYKSSITYFSLKVLGVNLDDPESPNNTAFKIPENIIISIIYPRATEVASNTESLSKLANLGKMYLQLCCWSYTMKYLSAPGRVVPGCFVNGYNMNMLGYVSPYEEIASIEDEFVSKEEFDNPRSPFYLHRYSPNNDINLCRPKSLAQYVKAIGLYDSIIYDSLQHNANREQQAISALYQTVGAVYQIHGSDKAKQFIDQRIMEGETGLVWLSVSNQ